MQINLKPSGIVSVDWQNGNVTEYSAVKGKVTLSTHGSNNVFFGIVGQLSPQDIPYTSVLIDGVAPASMNALLEHVNTNFRDASVSAADLAGAAFTGTVIPLDKVSGRFQVSAANGSATFATAANPIVGAFAVVLINRATEPTVTGATKIAGSAFQASTNMEMHVRYNGTTVQYYFAKL